MAKITGKEGLRFEGTAKVYDSEELMMAGLNRKEITPGTSTSPLQSVCPCPSEHINSNSRSAHDVLSFFLLGSVLF